MKKVRDTFLHFLADNMGTTPVHPIRRDPNDPGGEVLQLNAVNVEFFGVDLDTGVSTFQVAVDCIAEDETSVLNMVNSVWSLLKSAFYTPMLDYTNPASPTSTGRNIMWDRYKVRFKKVANPNYCHYTCLLTLRFHD